MGAVKKDNDEATDVRGREYQRYIDERIIRLRRYT